MCALGSVESQAHGFKSCPWSECSLGFFTRSNGFLAVVDEYTRLKLDLQKPATDVYTHRF
ncbi:hypothetical protein E2C01_017795 [Portunus trituberculatus]|uniref:Uncharacterized protein n=1 Tax=Portunus trituberculatus TaxID=210409 RepID=A0A5B7DUH6_PORTR|nr:hypothetical protein [Portunus trituberculatus]